MTRSLQTDQASLAYRQNLLIQANVQSLRQALRLVEQIDDRVYRESPAGLAPHRAGAHLRHILEFYECFLDGVESSHIDYDSRARDESIEASRRVAMGRIRATIHRLENSPELRGDFILWVRMEDTAATRGIDPYLVSSPGRELQVLSSHTIHHFALMTMTLRAHGVAVDPSFGMAPSTLRYLEALQSTPEAA